MLSASDRYLRVQAGLARRKRDPLQFWHFCTERVKDALKLFVDEDPIEELLARAANKAGKTETLAAYVLACLQKRKTLDGVPLPQWQGRVEGIALALDYPQQKLSTQQTILRLLGDWPHKLKYKGDGILSSIQVKYIGCEKDDPNWWSTLHFQSEENTRAGVGARADIVWFDEPPVIPILQELRKAGHAGRRCIRLIGLTPTIRRQWAPVKEQYGDGPRGCLRRIKGTEWAEVRWSLEDVAEWVLSPKEKAKLRANYARDPLADAREHGDYMDTSGLCPFDVETLTKMLDECVDPKIVNWTVSREVKSGEGTIKQLLKVPVEVYGMPKDGEHYYIPADLSSGIDDAMHDPSGLVVSHMGTGDLKARSVGYLDSYSRGILAAGLGTQYNQAALQPEVNDGWGTGFVQGARDSGYGNFAHDRRELSDGSWIKEVGFRTTNKSRKEMISAIQAWIAAYRAGVPYAKCPSRKIIECLLDCILDETGKPVAAPGLHDEDLIIWGQSLRKAVTTRHLPVPDRPEKRLTQEQKLMKLIQGEVEHDTPFGQDHAEDIERPEV